MNRGSVTRYKTSPDRWRLRVYLGVDTEGREVRRSKVVEAPHTPEGRRVAEDLLAGWAEDLDATVAGVSGRRQTRPRQARRASGLSERRGVPAPRLPIDPLCRAVGLPPGAVMARQTGVCRRELVRASVTGEITIWMADRLACRLGLHPSLVWGDDWWSVADDNCRRQKNHPVNRY